MYISNPFSYRYLVPVITNILDRIFTSPLAGCSLVSRAIRLVDMCNLGNQGVVGVGIGQHGADRKQDFRDGQSWAPLVSQDVQADAAVRVDVRVVDAGSEVDLRRLERVVCGEMDGEEENATGVW